MGVTTIWSLRLAGGAAAGSAGLHRAGLTSFGEDTAGELYLVGGDAVYRLAG